MLDLTIAIISYNSGKLISTKLKELISCENFSVIVVDNNSSDDSVQSIQHASSNVNIISLNSNIGYGRAANIAINQATTQYLLLLNPDIQVSVKEVENFFSSAIDLGETAVIYAPATKPDEITNTGWQSVTDILGAVMLFDLKRLSTYGSFDENLFLFYEEKDLCRRITESGGVILRSSDILFNHNKGTSSGPSKDVTYLKQWHVAWSSAYYLKKHKLNTGRHRLDMMMIKYSLKYLFSLSAQRRLKYKARIGGLLAYISGKKAFDENGLPQRIEVLKRLSKSTSD